MHETRRPLGKHETLWCCLENSLHRKGNSTREVLRLARNVQPKTGEPHIIGPILQGVGGGSLPTFKDNWP